MERLSEPDAATLSVNGRPVPLDCSPRDALADVLRTLGWNSVHLGCEHGVCGACNVLIDGRCSRSCLVLAQSCDRSEVRTMDGLQDELATALRAAFSRHHALQCGFCTPGMFVSAYDLLSERRPLDEATVRERMSGNICRCTGYQGIVEAILDVAAHHSGAAA